MKKKIVSILFVLVLVVSMSLVTAVPATAGTTYSVDDDCQIGVPPYAEDTDGDTDFATIQAAIDAANPGDTIIVHDGTYTENVDVKKSFLTIKSANGPAYTTVQAANPNDYVFYVGWSGEYVTITGFTVTGTIGPGLAGIYMESMRNCNISQNIATNNNFGILLSNSKNNVIESNNSSNNSYGLYLNNSSDNNTVRNNTFSNNEYGIWINYSSNNGVENNSVTNSIEGIEIQYSHYNIIKGNTVKATRQSGIQLANGSTYNTIEYNTSLENGSGIGLDTSSNNTIKDNTIQSNRTGMSLVVADSNTIDNNAFSNNGIGVGGSAIWLSSSSNNQILRNEITANYCGVGAWGATRGNKIWHNNFVNNTHQTCDDGDDRIDNVWDDGYPSGGNYWRDYTGLDLYSGVYQDEPGSDGIGDVPYSIPGSTYNQDHYPFWMESGWVNQPPTADAGGPYDGDEGSPITFDASTSSDLDGDPLQYRWDFDNDQIWDTDWLDVPMASCTWGDDYSGTVTVEVSDGQLTDTAAADVIVNNAAPTVGEITAPVDPVQVNTEIYTSADFTDSGVLDTHTAVWDWGDDSTSPGTITEMDGSGSMSGSHTYTAAGVYTVTLTVTDDDGGSGQSVLQYVVVYDPEGGFVTGGGWIDSPEGAYTDDPSLTGKATFGFVSKYKKGAEYPSGETQFRFRVADLNFHSTSYEWLVVAGAKAKFKGKGTINGSGEYKFLLTAIDANINDSDTFDVDRFRIKIWCEDGNTEAVKYDNALGDDNATTEIGGGSIVVHKK